MDRTTFCSEHDCGCFIHVERRIECKLVSLKRFSSDVHSDRRIAGGRSVNGNCILVRDTEQGLIRDAEFLFALVNVTSTKIVKLSGRHRTLKLRRFDYLAKERVCIEQH